MWSVPDFCCGVCDAPVDANSPTSISCCARPCGMSFHTRCVGVTENFADVLAANAGSCWFCPSCLPEVLQAGRPVPRPGNERRLPAEVWELIFGHLSCAQLLRVRLTCHHWKSIVDGCRKITNRFTVYFPPYMPMDQRYNPTRMQLVPATRAVFSSKSRTTIETVDSWWPSFGPRLTVLNMGTSETLLPTFVAMLRHTPNLERIEVGEVDCRFDDLELDLDFQLLKLEYLSIPSDMHEDVLDVFRVVSRFIKSFIIRKDSHMHRYPMGTESTLKFVDTVKHSLEELECDGENDLVLEICQLENLKLKKLSLRRPGHSNILQVTRLQPLRSLSLSTGNGCDRIFCSKLLRKVGPQCPELKHFSMSHVKSDYACDDDYDSDDDDELVIVPSLLNTLPELETLKLASYRKLQLNFEGIRNEHIAEVSLDNIEPVGESLKWYFQQSPRLTTVSLSQCSFQDWPDALRTLQCVEQLEDLSLTEVTVEDDYHVDPNLRLFEQLKSLKLTRCSFGAACRCEVVWVFNQITGLCPKLRELEVRGCDSLEILN